jgi:hypothetical protein
MARFGQVGIALGVLGLVITLMGLFPQLTGATLTTGIGLVQVLMMLSGYFLMVLGALIYLKTTFYLNIPSTLIQMIGVRLTWTGILFAGMTGMADIFGFGSHFRGEASDIFLGELQMVGILLSFFASAVGIIIYAVAGTPRLNDESTTPDSTPKVDIEQVLNDADKENSPPTLTQD